jgi:hypothetical protein
MDAVLLPNHLFCWKYLKLITSNRSTCYSIKSIENEWSNQKNLFLFQIWCFVERVSELAWSKNKIEENSENKFFLEKGNGIKAITFQSSKATLLSL